MNIDDEDSVTERFYKVDKSRDRSLGGNGLGLSIVKKIIDLHGGKISLSSEIGKGTEFTILLPK
jgi:signal transduction histidine kinase